MKIRQAKKLLLRPWNKASEYWLDVVRKESGRSCLPTYRDHRLQAADVALKRWIKNMDVETIQKELKI